MNKSHCCCGKKCHASTTHSLSEQGLVKHEHILLHPDPSRTVIRPFAPEYPEPFRGEHRPRAREIVDRVLSLTKAALTEALVSAKAALDERHRDVDTLLLSRADEIISSVQPLDDLNEEQRLLVGAYFCNEYAFESAALFNPSMVIAPKAADDTDDGSVRFIMSLRGIGEGHVSSVTFRTGTWTPCGEITIDAASPIAMPPLIEPSEATPGMVRLGCNHSRDISETVLFPILPSQRQGIEDLRLVQFVDEDGSKTFYGTYTAFDGRDARPELLTTNDFCSFEMHQLTGSAAQSKGMALFPRRVQGRYAMLGRQDSESIWFHQSDELLSWEGGTKLISPRYPWEFIQLGNCGSPIEIEEGWLVLTHGVGVVRNYCIGACLLDRNDPSKVLARSSEPILAPSPSQRDGYVPNVVYSCGGIVRDRMLLLPFGVADTFATIATVSLDDLIKSM